MFGSRAERGQTRSVPLIQPWRALGDYLLPLGSLWVTIDYLTGALHEFRAWADGRLMYGFFDLRSIPAALGKDGVVFGRQHQDGI